MDISASFCESGYAARSLALALGVRGLINAQFAVKDDNVYCLEVNPRASRTVPFVGQATGVRLADGERLAAGSVVIAAGAWAGSLAGVPADARVPVRPVKGQLLRLRDPAGPGLLERVLRTEDFYVVPRGDGDYVLGATVEERGFDDAVTAGALHDLLRDAVEVIPGITELELVEARAGLRPGTPDNAPAVGPSELDGLHWATGHYRHGVLLAPLTADLVVDGLTGAAPGADAALLAPGRFGARARTEVPA